MPVGESISFELYVYFALGIQMGSCGDVAVRFRPALIFAERHAQIVLDKMNEVAKKF